MIKDFCGILAVAAANAINCDVGQYLDYKNCVCRKSVIDKIVEECTSVVDGDVIYDKNLNLISPSRTPYVVLFIVFLLISAIISGVFVYYHRKRNKKLGYVNVNYSTTGKIDY